MRYESEEERERNRKEAQARYRRKRRILDKQQLADLSEAGTVTIFALRRAIRAQHRIPPHILAMDPEQLEAKLRPPGSSDAR